MTTNQKKNKTKKIRIIIAIILTFVTLIGGAFISISLIKTSHIMKFNNPDKIIVSYNSKTNNTVFEPGDSEYQTICNLINNAHKQTILTSIFNGELFKDVSIVEHNAKNINFDGMKVSFVYNTPQIAKLESKTYSKSIWYQTLIFDVSSKDAFDYNSTAIISPETNGKEVNTYTSYYLSYSNLGYLYTYLIDMFN